MTTQMLSERDGTRVSVTLGDFATATVDDVFDLVYLLRNTITNLTSQDEQVECFRNAARHLRPGSTFLVENYVPELRRIPPGEHSLVFTATPSHIGVDEYDFLNQVEVSRHWWTMMETSGRSRPHTATCGLPSSTSWPASLGCVRAHAGATGTKHHSQQRAAATSPRGRRSRSQAVRDASHRGRSCP